MDGIEQENALLEQRIAQLESELSGASTQPQAGGSLTNALATATGGAINLGDILTFGQLSKGIAAAPAIARDIYGLATGAAPQDYYAEELAKVNALKELYAGQREAAGLTGLETALSFMAPVPSGKAQALTSIAPAAKEAGLGLAAYLGSEVGQAIAPESPYAGLAGAVAAPLSLQSGAALAQRGASRLGQALAPSVGLLKGDEQVIADIAAKEILERAGTEGAARIAAAQELGAPLTSALGVPLTAAEIAQSPGLATYQYQMMKPEMGGTPLIDLATARKAEQELAMGQLGSFAEKGDLAATVRDIASKQRGAEILGNEADVVRNIDLQIQSVKPETMSTPSELVKALGSDTAAKIRVAKDETKAAARADFKDPEVYNVIVDVPNIKKDVTSLVKQWKRTPTQTIDDSRVAKQIARLRKLDMPKEDLPAGFVPTVKIGELHDVQVKLGEVLSGAKPGEYTPSQALARSVWQYVDDVMEKAPGSEKLFAAKAKYRDYFDTFVYNRELQRPSPLNQALKKSPEKVLPFLAKESFGVSAMQKAGVGLDNLETLKLSEFANLTDAKKKLAWIEKNRPQLSDASFWPQIENYAAELKGITQPVKRAIDPFENITEGQIPSKIFGDEDAAAEFMKRFRGTEAEVLARGKWIQQAKNARGGLAEQYNTQKKVVKQIFGEDTAQIERIINDLQGSASVQALTKAGTGKQSISGQTATTIGSILRQRPLLQMMKTGKFVGWLPGVALGGLPGVVTAAAGEALGVAASRLAVKREDELNAMIGKMLADPSLIKIAAAPPTKENVFKFMDAVERAGFVAARGAAQEESPVTETPAMSPEQQREERFKQENMMLEQRIMELEKQYQPAEEKEVKVGKQNISIPTGEAYAPANLVKAVIQVESAGKPDAVSSKGARGLMQLMPATARDLGVDATDPKENVEGGSRYLAQQLKKFGNPELALAAYNWGPTNVERAIKKIEADGKKPTWALVKQYVKVPMETRKYVDKVLSLA